MVTLGFTIGLTWRETIVDVSWAFIQWLTSAQAAPTLSILTSIFSTLICVGLIHLTSYLLKESPSEY